MEVAHPPPLAAAYPARPSKCAAELEQADFLAIDDLLDFSNDDIGGPIEPCLSSATSSDLTINIQAPASTAFDRLLPSQPCGFDSNSLCVPCDDLAELEWLSNFVEESFSPSDAPSCFGNFAAHSDAGNDDKAPHRCSSDEAFRTTSPVSVLEANGLSREKHGSPFSFTPDMSSVPGRARSKRCRTAVCFWNTRILCPEVSESLLETASTPYTIAATSSESDMYNSYYDYDDGDEGGNDDSDDDAPVLRFQPNHEAKNLSTKVKNSCNSKAKGSMKQCASAKLKKVKLDDPAPVRKCLHCATQKTPQWRAGPMGPKTLCNACGVRYKSGRLCDEYRPAASPTFIESVHSNSHRKVLEMRRQRGDSGVNGNENHKLHKDNGHRLKLGTNGSCSNGVAVAAADTDIDGHASLLLEENKEDSHGE